MKTQNLLTKTVVLTACLSTAVFAVAGPGNGKVLKNTAQALFQAPRLSRGVAQHFSFSPEVTARIRTGIEAGHLERIVDTAALQYSPIPAPIFLGNIPTEWAFAQHQMIASVPLEKEVLLANVEESKFYAPEIEAAQNLHLLVSNIKTLDEETVNAIVSSILKDIKNHSLQTYLLKSLAAQNLYMLDLDLTEYFSLNKPVEITAFNYTLRHPHQQTLMIRRLLNNPLVDEVYKKDLRAFLSKSHIKPEDFPAFQAAISNLYTQYQERMAAATESDSIQMQVNYLNQMITRLSDFVVSHNGRRPKWNTLEYKEWQLFEEIEWVMTHKERNQFEPLLSYQNELERVWKNAEPVYLTPQETLLLYEDFVKVTNRSFPHSLREPAKPDEIRFAREEELWDNLFHWKLENNSIDFELRKIYNQYHK